MSMCNMSSWRDIGELLYSFFFFTFLLVSNNFRTIRVQSLLDHSFNAVDIGVDEVLK